jgi:hypothetical protein
MRPTGLNRVSHILHKDGIRGDIARLLQPLCEARSAQPATLCLHLVVNARLYGAPKIPIPDATPTLPIFPVPSFPCLICFVFAISEIPFNILSDSFRHAVSSSQRSPII